MPPASGAANAAAKRPASRDTATPATGTSTSTRITRLRAAKETLSANPSPALRSKPSGLLAKSKEGLRKVSDKMKESQKDKKVPAVTSTPSYTQTLQAFLRIRPPPTDAAGSNLNAKPYLEPQDDTRVIMRSPIDPARLHIAPRPPVVYSFNKVFAPPTSQSSFFTETTLPLVEKLLQGENGLMFAYGVSNSGKSYTISGGSDHEPSERGMLPRSIDVVFNSIQGMEFKANLRCTGMADVEIVKQEEQPKLFDHLPSGSEACTQEAVKVDRNHSYAVFVSYAEIYNEKIFDLLDNVLPVSGGPSDQSTSKHKLSTSYNRGSSAWAMSGAIHSSMNLAALANGGGGVIKRQALTLKNDPDGSGKYIAGLKEIRVRTREEALAVFRAGQGARQVFGTLANRESSRSHGVFTIKVVKVNNGAPNDPESIAVSRLAIVDLAGSERTRNTGTTGDRLKEAGNINKSLMVLGQCMEVLRANQEKLAAPAAPGTRKKLAIVPYRHSKLTEIFQSFFDGDGRAAMIVNVNPYDTGFDENSHVMRFSAIARGVQTTASNKVTFGGGMLRRQISTQFSNLRQAVSGPMKVKVTVPVLPKEDSKNKPALERQDSFVMVEEELEVVEEDAEDDLDDDRDVLVDHLFEQLRELKERLYESEMRNATVEVEVREEVAREMQETIQKMHESFNLRLQEQLDAGQVKTDRKIDILSRTMATPAVGRIVKKPLKAGQTYLESTPEIDMDSASSADVSFESAIDRSLIEGSVSPLSFRPRISDVTDPFLTQSPLRREAFSEASETEEDEEDEEEVETEGEEETEDEEMIEVETASIVDKSRADDLSHVQRGTSAPADRIISVLDDSEDEDGDVSRVTASTDSDEDVLADLTGDISTLSEGSVAVQSRKSVPEQDGQSEDEDEDASEEDTATDDEATEGGSSDEDLSEEEDGEEEDEDVLDSSFAVSEDNDKSVSSASPSPVRRQSIKRRPTVSPTKARATPMKSKATPAKATKGGWESVARLQSILKEKEVSQSTPLSETKRQESIMSISDDEIQEVQPVKAKKKRTLGKKVVMEDEMGGEDVKGSGADIKRMGARNVLRG